MNLVEYDGDLSKLNGELLAGWFIANPNGPTAFALGFVEYENSRRMFYKWMHFTGGKTWLSQELASYFTHSVANFGEILFNELVFRPEPQVWAAEYESPINRSDRAQAPVVILFVLPFSLWSGQQNSGRHLLT